MIVISYFTLFNIFLHIKLFVNFTYRLYLTVNVEKIIWLVEEQYRINPNFGFVLENCLPIRRYSAGLEYQLCQKITHYTLGSASNPVGYFPTRIMRNWLRIVINYAVYIFIESITKVSSIWFIISCQVHQYSGHHFASTMEIAPSTRLCVQISSWSVWIIYILKVNYV